MCTRDLPDPYQKIWGLDLAQDRKTALLLNLVSLPLFVLFGGFFVLIAAALKSDIMNIVFLTSPSAKPLVLYLDLFCTIAGMTILHEAVHGMFFWIFTQSKPVFGIRLLFAFAGAPGWYIPRNLYVIIGLAPVVLISVTGLLLLPFTSLYVAQLLLFAVVMNAAGAIGDLYVCGKVLNNPDDVLIQDTGFVFTMYGRSEILHTTLSEQYTEGVKRDEQ